MPPAKKARKSAPDPAKAYIQRVPREVIGEIILLALESEYPTGLPPISLKTTDGVWKYAHVCSLWRREVFSRPFFWSHIDLDSTIYDIESSAAFEFMNTVLERSNNHELTLALRFDSQDFNSESAAAVVSVAVAQCTRWECVSLQLGTKTLMNQLKAVRNKIPRLQSLKIVGVDGLDGFISDDLVGCLEDAPALRCVSLDRIFEKDVDKLRIPWSQITQFEEHFFESGLGTKHLMSMPAICRYSFRSLHPSYSLPWLESIPRISNRIRLEQLRCLRINDNNLYQDLHDLDMLTLPNLSELEISSESRLQPYLDLVRRSKCSIETLHLDISAGIQYRYHFKAFCKELMQVTTIVLGDNAISLLIHRWFDSDAFPQLKTVSLLSIPTAITKFFEEALGGFLRDRSVASRDLHEFIIAFPEWEEHQWKRRRKEMTTRFGALAQKAGVELVLKAPF